MSHSANVTQRGAVGHMKTPPEVRLCGDPGIGRHAPAGDRVGSGPIRSYLQFQNPECSED